MSWLLLLLPLAEATKGAGGWPTLLRRGARLPAGELAALLSSLLL